MTTRSAAVMSEFRRLDVKLAIGTLGGSGCRLVINWRRLRAMPT